jgi:hypothetical protein
VTGPRPSASRSVASRRIGGAAGAGVIYYLTALDSGQNEFDGAIATKCVDDEI